MITSNFLKNALFLDIEKEKKRICESVRFSLARRLKRRGLVIGLSGGIDSTVTLGLAVEAIGPDRVLGLLMPEKYTADQTDLLARKAANHFNIKIILEDITEMLKAARHYERYDDAVRLIIPEYGEGWTSKIVSNNLLENKTFTFFYIVAQTPNGMIIKRRLPLKPYLKLIAAMNFKQRIRKMIEYYHADRLNYAVAGTPNRLEYELGFFVKNGDGAADLKPIAHLYKTQVYQMARHLHVPEEIIQRPPTTDTYSMPQGQDEFFFSLPYEKMDLCLFARNSNIKPEALAEIIGLNSEEIQRFYDDIDSKRSAARYQHLHPLLAEDI